VGLCSKMEVNFVHSVNRWTKVDGECFCVVTGGSLWVSNSLVLTCLRWSLPLKSTSEEGLLIQCNIVYC
jgi:hypothetical protein